MPPKTAPFNNLRNNRRSPQNAYKNVQGTTPPRQIDKSVKDLLGKDLIGLKGDYTDKV